MPLRGKPVSVAFMVSKFAHDTSACSTIGAHAFAIVIGRPLIFPDGVRVA